MEQTRDEGVTLAFHVKDLLRMPLVIASFGIPVYWVYRCIETLAGKTTVVGVDVAVLVTGSFTLTGISGVWAALERRRSNKRLELLQHQRERIRQLEGELGGLTVDGASSAARVAEKRRGRSTRLPVEEGIRDED